MDWKLIKTFLQALMTNVKVRLNIAVSCTVILVLKPIFKTLPNGTDFYKIIFFPLLFLAVLFWSSLFVEVISFMFKKFQSKKI
ncbi:hypothetical protein [Lactobacillus acetotolerans]|uniref:hypothetical protein n=1 Tax=Lactobacillus acetotolerans TaxID=1600 RepID=UPI0007B91503|nr:hypothetical protein [Lactobacillus acetotolerans]QGV04404.1 hypothetical protein GJR85_02810 [Lactobacillus acetotolerans]